MIWQPGTTLQQNKYKIVQELGSGGFGTTYKVFHTLLKQYFALKTPNFSQNSNTQEEINRFTDEAQKLSKLCEIPHPHIAQIKDFFVENNVYCLVIAYIDGNTVNYLISKQGKLSENQAIKYIRQIGSALAFLHQGGCTHRDVNPRNIMIQLHQDRAILIDFGLAKDIVRTNSNRNGLSRAGSPDFAPWEQFHLGSREVTVDVYSLAGTLYYMVTGNVPKFNQKQILIKPKDDNPSISDRLNDMIIWGLELQPTERPSNIELWLDFYGNYSGNGEAGDELRSDKGVDYRNLRDLLKTKAWKEADQETYYRMLEAVGKTQQQWLNQEDINQFSCVDLQTINQLWLKYSNRQFGFSVQRDIYQSIYHSNRHDQRQAWEKFYDRVKWKKDGKWLKYEELKCFRDKNNIIPGQLPRMALRDGNFFEHDRLWLNCMIYRLDKCKI